MTLPSARTTDMHVCFMFSGLTPHVGGPILPPCAPKVLTGGLPQARVSDMATCTGPPDVIAMGAASVLIEGLPAARFSDTTAHGGKIAAGFPQVLIGGLVFVARPIKQTFKILKWEWQWQYGDAITISPDPNDPNFQSRTLAALIRLETSPTMRNAFNALDSSGKNVNIIRYVPPPGWDPFNAYCQPHEGASAKDGRGSDSTVAWDPAVHGFGPPGTTPDSSQPGADIILGHELIHATHNATGTTGNGPYNSAGSNVSEERSTVGLPASTYNDPNDPSDALNGTALPDTSGFPYTENGVRRDYANAGIPSPITGNPPVQRPSYGTPTPSDGPGSPF
jgi:uncharacterized Zn-binding protein involved in type VI secretion